MKKSNITREYEYLKVDGRYFKPVHDGERINYVEVDKSEFDNRIKLLKQIADKLKDSLDKEAVLIEALSKLEDNYLETIWGHLNNPMKKIKPKTRRHHCVDMRVGKLTIPIIN